MINKIFILGRLGANLEKFVLNSGKLELVLILL
ncbi:MAG: hypothetical protein PWQ70_1826 [Clostridiales bacterium]|nr:hypothetical protein [Clostridiales bacterium]